MGALWEKAGGEEEGGMKTSDMDPVGPRSWTGEEMHSV